MSKRNKLKDSDTESENSLANSLNNSDNNDDDNESIDSSIVENKKPNSNNKRKKASKRSSDEDENSEDYDSDEDDFESEDDETSEDEEDDDDESDSDDSNDGDWNESSKTKKSKKSNLKNSKKSSKSKKQKTSNKKSSKTKKSNKMKTSKNSNTKKNASSNYNKAKSREIIEDDDDDIVENDINISISNNNTNNALKKRTISDVEDGELSGSGNDSDGSISSTSSSSQSSVFSDGYDSDYIGNDEDRRRLDMMTEKEREEEIYRRTEQRDILKKRFEINKKIKQQQKAAEKAERHKRREEKRKLKKVKKNKEKSSGTKTGSNQLNDKTNNLNKEEREEGEEDDSNSLMTPSTIMDRRKANESKKKDTGVSKALANLKADREKKKQIAEDNRQRLEKLQQQQKKLRTEDVFSSSSSSEEEEDEDDVKSSKKKRRNSASSSEDDSESGESSDDDSSSSSDESSKFPIQTKEDLNKIKLSRYKIEKWCHAPFFKQVSIGCYVRIGIGMNQGESIYRVAEIVDIVETAKVYQLGSTRTNKGFKLRHGKEERTYRLEFVSNSPFTDDEFKRWKDALTKSNTPLPTQRYVDNKCKEIQSFVDYRFKDEDIDVIVKEKKRFQKDTDKIAEKKIELLKKKQEASERNDSEAVKQYDQDLDELNEIAIDLNVKRSGNFNLLASINQRNRALSNIAVEEAMRQEFERQKQAKDDPFQRRKGFGIMAAAAAVKKNKKTSETAGSGTGSQSETGGDDKLKKTDENKTKGDQPPSSGIKKVGSTIFEDLLAPAIKSNDQEKKLNDEDDLKLKLDQLPSVDPKLINSALSSSKTNINKSSNVNDLFQAHNFDINIDLAVPIATSQLQPINNGNAFNQSGGHLGRRGLNLDEYKRKKGLI